METIFMMQFKNRATANIPKDKYNGLVTDKATSNLPADIKLFILISKLPKVAARMTN